MVAAAVIGGAVIGAAGSAYAGSEQAGASENAQNLQQQNYNTQLQNESGYVKSGNEANSQLNYLLGEGPDAGAGTSSAGGYGSLLSPFTENTFHTMSPAYQFQLQQGQQGTLNGDSSGAGALSGAAQKDLMSFNQADANTAFNNAFNQYQTQQSNIYGRLAGVANTGESAASNQATGGSAYSGAIGQSATNTGTASAAGTVGATNAIDSGLTNAAIWSKVGGNPSTTDSLQDDLF